MRITFIQTGGTIDKDYPHTTGGWAFEIADPAFGRVLERLEPSFEFHYRCVCKKDSTEMTDADREALVTLIGDLDCDRIVVTHGTDTMIQTARFVDQRVADKTVVFTGAMRPERFTHSDAPFNLGLAVGAAQLQSHGTWVAMHGVVRPADQARRNPETGRFE